GLVVAVGPVVVARDGPAQSVRDGPLPPLIGKGLPKLDAAARKVRNPGVGAGELLPSVVRHAADDVVVAPVDVPDPVVEVQERVGADAGRRAVAVVLVRVPVDVAPKAHLDVVGAGGEPDRVVGGPEDAGARQRSGGDAGSPEVVPGVGVAVRQLVVVADLDRGAPRDAAVRRMHDQDLVVVVAIVTAGAV